MTPNLLRALSLAACAACFCAGAVAQAPVVQPSLAEQAATVSPAELARRQAQASDAAACRKAARELKGAKATREAARLKCEATFKAQVSTWNDPASQLR